MLANLKTLFLADMGPIPLTILSPFGQLRSLNLSGNHMINISLTILDPANNLEVSANPKHIFTMTCECVCVCAVQGTLNYG